MYSTLFRPSIAHENYILQYFKFKRLILKSSFFFNDFDPEICVVSIAFIPYEFFKLLTQLVEFCCDMDCTEFKFILYEPNELFGIISSVC